MLRSLALILGSLLVAATATAEEAPSWQPPPPDEDGWDWLQTTSGEWLKGEILLMRDFEISIDSDEMDTMVFDWDDIAFLRSPNKLTYVREDLKAFEGTALMREGVVVVAVEDGSTVEIPQVRLLAITPADDREIDLWTARGSAGVELADGNTDEFRVNGDLDLVREGRTIRTALHYDGVFAEVNGEKTTDNHRASAQLDVFLTRKLFLIPGRFWAFTDEFQNIEYRLSAVSGLGYYLLRNARTDLRVGLGAGYQHVRFDSVPAGESADADNALLFFESLLDTELNSRLDLVLQYQLQAALPDAGATNHHGEAKLEIELTSILDLDLKFVWDRIEDPEEDDGGDQPESDDFRFITALALDF